MSRCRGCGPHTAPSSPHGRNQVNDDLHEVEESVRHDGHDGVGAGPESEEPLEVELDYVEQIDHQDDEPQVRKGGDY
jgi:hypothetical protein